MDQNNNPTPNEPVADQPPMQTVEPVPPVAPVQPPVFTAQPSIASQPTMSAPAPKKNKLLPIFIAAGALVLLVAIGLVVWYTMFAVTKDDYSKALSATKEIRNAYTDAGDKFGSFMSESMSSYSTASEVSTAKSDFTKAYADYKTKVDALKDMKAMRDSEVKKSYDAFTAQNKKMTDMTEAFAAVAPDLNTMKTECSSSSMSSTLSSATPDTLLTKYDAGIKPCLDATKKLTETSITPLSDYAKKSLETFDKMRGYVKRMQDAYTANDRTAYTTAHSEFSSFTSSSSSSLSSYKLTNDLRDYTDKAEVKDQLNAFGELITKKANGK